MPEHIHSSFEIFYFPPFLKWVKINFRVTEKHAPHTCCHHREVLPLSWLIFRWQISIHATQILAIFSRKFAFFEKKIFEIFFWCWMVVHVPENVPKIQQKSPELITIFRWQFCMHMRPKLAEIFENYENFRNFSMKHTDYCHLVAAAGTNTSKGWQHIWKPILKFRCKFEECLCAYAWVSKFFSFSPQLPRTLP